MFACLLALKICIIICETHVWMNANLDADGGEKSMRKKRNFLSRFAFQLYKQLWRVCKQYHVLPIIIIWHAWYAFKTFRVTNQKYCKIMKLLGSVDGACHVDRSMRNFKLELLTHLHITCSHFSSKHGFSIYFAFRFCLLLLMFWNLATCESERERFSWRQFLVCCAFCCRWFEAQRLGLPFIHLIQCSFVKANETNFLAENKQ